MKKTTFVILLFFVTCIFAQSNKKESWSFGIGLSNHTMAGDHRSIATGLSDGSDSNNPFNLGAYIYVDKMFNPAFGLELKAHYTSMAGSAQEVTSDYSVLFAPTELKNTNFDGTAYGAELNVIVNFSNLAVRPYRTKPRKWNLAGYLGMGIQHYDSKLYDNVTGETLLDFGDSPSEDGIANSVYYTAGLGLKYKLSKKIDIEFRPTVNLNEEDHLDAAISSKQSMEVFYQTNLGLVFKLNDKDHDNYVWHDEIEVIEEKPDINKLVDDAVAAKLATRDLDKDGFTDDVDSCPARYSKTNNGCPGDRDNDGVADDIDLCPDEPGERNNNGCTLPDQTPTVLPTAVAYNHEDYISRHVYFDLNSDVLSHEAKTELNDIALYMMDYPTAQFSVQGNTDKGGNLDYNQDLSQRRANNVKDYLISKGANPENIEVLAYGKTRPKFEDKIFNRLNRRVDIKLKN